MNDAGRVIHEYACGCWWVEQDNMVLVGSVCNDCMKAALRVLTLGEPQYKLPLHMSREAPDGKQAGNP